MNEVKYPIFFIQDIGNLIQRPKNEIKFVVLNVPQASKKEHTGFFAVAFTYLILKGKTASRCTVNPYLLTDQLINFIEYSVYSGTFSHITAHTSFTKRLYYHCILLDISERMKECDCCKNWFHQHCKNLERISCTNINLSQWYRSSNAFRPY